MGIHEMIEECDNCGGLGVVAGCFESTCSGSDCDPEDAEYCCAPTPCDWCRQRIQTKDSEALSSILGDAINNISVCETGEKE